MKIVLPITEFSFASNDTLKAIRMKKHKNDGVSMAGMQSKQGLSNQEIYQSLVSIKERFICLIGKNKASENQFSAVI